MKRKLLIEVDCVETECGNCEYIKRYHNSGVCYLFHKSYLSYEQIIDDKRCEQCLAAEQHEDWDLK